MNNLAKTLLWVVITITASIQTAHSQATDNVIGQHLVISSELLHEDREIQIYLPQG